jgi:regulator of protease activity HflC (stomatin/prohibitin superfamily)
MTVFYAVVAVLVGVLLSGLRIAREYERGVHDLDEVLQERDKINALLKGSVEASCRGASSSSASR